MENQLYNVYINENGELKLIMESVGLRTAQLKVINEKEWYRIIEKTCPEFVIISV